MDDSSGYVQLNLDSTKRFRESTSRRGKDAIVFEPRDRCAFVRFALFLCGIGFLLPYNSFVVAVDYYQLRFPGATDSWHDFRALTRHDVTWLCFRFDNRVRHQSDVHLRRVLRRPRNQRTRRHLFLPNARHVWLRHRAHRSALRHRV